MIGLLLLLENHSKMKSKVITILLVLFLTIKSNSTEETEPKPESNFAKNGLQEFKYQAMSVSSLDNHFGLIYNETKEQTLLWVKSKS